MKIMVFDSSPITYARAGDTPACVTLLPDSALLVKNQPVFLPEFAASYEAIVLLLWRVCRLGKHVSARFASRYRDAASLAVLTRPAGEKLADATNALRHGFDGALATGSWLDMEQDLAQALEHVVVSKNGTMVSSVDTEQRQFMDQRLCYASRHVTLKMGDLIGTPVSSPTSVQPGDVVEASSPTAGLLARVRYK